MILIDSWKKKKKKKFLEEKEIKLMAKIPLQKVLSDGIKLKRCDDYGKPDLGVK